MSDECNERGRVQPRKPSQTAGLATTFCRACASTERDERLRGLDYLAKVFHVSSPSVLLAFPGYQCPEPGDSRRRIGRRCCRSSLVNLDWSREGVLIWTKQDL